MTPDRPQPCLRCNGRLFLDKGYGQAELAPSLVCYQCGGRMELDLNGAPLAVIQPPENSYPLGQRVRAMRSRGMSIYQISKELTLDRRTVETMLNQPAATPAPDAL